MGDLVHKADEYAKQAGIQVRFVSIHEKITRYVASQARYGRVISYLTWQFRSRLSHTREAGSN